MKSTNLNGRTPWAAFRRYWKNSRLMSVLMIVSGIVTILLGLYSTFWGERNAVFLILVVTGTFAVIEGRSRIREWMNRQQEIENQRIAADHEAYERGYPDRSK